MSAAELPSCLGELSEKILQHTFYKLPPNTVCRSKNSRSSRTLMWFRSHTCGTPRQSGCPFPTRPSSDGNWRTRTETDVGRRAEKSHGRRAGGCGGWPVHDGSVSWSSRMSLEWEKKKPLRNCFSYNNNRKSCLARAHISGHEGENRKVSFCFRCRCSLLRGSHTTALKAGWVFLTNFSIEHVECSFVHSMSLTTWVRLGWLRLGTSFSVAQPCLLSKVQQTV